MIVYVGRVSIEKNIEKIIKALALIKEKNIENFKFVLVGDGTAMKQLNNLTESLGLNEKVKFVAVSYTHLK